MPTQVTNQRYYPNLKDQVPYHAEQEFIQLRKMAYDLFDGKVDWVDKTLDASWRVDRDLITGKPLVVIARQDTVGGRSVQWAPNPDGSLKFKGTSLVTVTTTANTYTAYLFLSTSSTEAMLISYVTGGNLS